LGIERNLAVKDLAAYLRDHFVAGFGGGRPVLDITFGLNYRVGRLEPWNFHATNVAIHLMVVLLVWAFTRRVATLAGAPRAPWISAVAAGLFALHPLQSEAVSYVSQRAESLASGFYVATVLLLLETTRQRRIALRAAAFVGALLSFVLGVGTKAIVLTAPAAYLLVTWAVSGAPVAQAELAPARKRVAIVAPFLAIAAVVAIATLRSLAGHRDAGFDVPGATPWQYLLTQMRAVVTYLRLLALPVGQNVDWDFPLSTTFVEPAVLASTSVLLAIAAGAIALVLRAADRRDAGGGAARLVGLGALWFFLVLSVTSSLVPLADVLVEHRVYLASWGAFAAAAAAGERVAARVPSRWRWSAVLAIAVVFGLLATALHLRNAVWETREALWRDAVVKSPNKPRPYLSLGWAYRTRGRYDEAIATYRAGLARADRDPAIELELIVNLGAALDYAGRIDEAIAVYRRGLEKAPDWPDLIVNMGIALENLGDTTSAEAWLRRGVAVAPTNPWALNALGALRLRLGDPLGALSFLDRARVLDPDFAWAHFKAGQALDELGRRRDACAAWRTAIAVGLDGDARTETERLARERCQ